MISLPRLKILAGLSLEEKVNPFSVGDKVSVKFAGRKIWKPATIIEIKPDMFRVQWDHDGGKVWYSNWANVKPL